MEKNKNVPQIRFEGFEEEWEQRKLGEITSSFEYGLNAAAKEFDGENKYIRITDIDDETRQFLQIDLTSPDINFQNAEKYKLHEGDIVFARTGASVGKTYIYKRFDGLVYYAGFLIRAKIKPEFSADFVFYNTLTIDYEKFIRITSQRSGQPGVNAQEYAEYEIYMPSNEEQTKISKLFNSLDNLITLHQRKYKKLLDLKKTMLYKLFPQEGETTPEIRFEGFDDPWEQRKLGDVAEIIGGGTPSTSIPEYWDGDIDWYTPAEISDQIYLTTSQRKITNEGYNSCSAKILPIGTVLFTSRAGIGKTAILSQKACTNQGFQSIIPHIDELDSYFIFSRSEELKKYGEMVGAGSTFFEVSGKQMANMNIMLPKTIDEQAVIGKYFRNLDKLITLQKQKYEKLLNIKKSMLDKLFPQ